MELNETRRVIAICYWLWASLPSRLSVVSASSIFGSGWQSGSLGLLLHTAPQGSSSCGYPLLGISEWPYGKTATISAYSSLAVCGSCVEIATGQGSYSFTVQITDFCQDCETNSLLLSSPAAQAVGQPEHFNNKSSVHFRQVSCDPPGNMVLEASTGSEGALLTVPLQVAGTGSVSAMDVRTSGTGDSGWNGMAYAAGSLFIVQSPPQPPLDFRITPLSGLQLIALSTVESLGENGTYPTDVQASRNGLPFGPGIKPTVEPPSQPAELSSPTPAKGSGASGVPLISLMSAPGAEPLPSIRQPSLSPLAGPGSLPHTHGPSPVEPPPSAEEAAPSQATGAAYAEMIAKTLLQRQSISMQDAVSLRLPLCVPVQIGQLSRCVPVSYGSSAPQPSVGKPTLDEVQSKMSSSPSPGASAPGSPADAANTHPSVGPGVPTPQQAQNTARSAQPPQPSSPSMASSLLSELPITADPQPPAPPQPRPQGQNGTSVAPVPSVKGTEGAAAPAAAEFAPSATTIGLSPPPVGARGQNNASNASLPAPPQAPPPPAGLLISSLPIVAAPAQPATEGGVPPPPVPHQGPGGSTNSLSQQVASGDLGGLAASQAVQPPPASRTAQQSSPPAGPPLPAPEHQPGSLPTSASPREGAVSPVGTKAPGGRAGSLSPSADVAVNSLAPSGSLLKSIQGLITDSGSG